MDRMKELRQALLEMDAHHLASHPKTFHRESSQRGRYDVYMVNGRLFVVDVIQSKRGAPENWDILVPVCTDTKIDATIEALKTWAKSAS